MKRLPILVFEVVTVATAQPSAHDFWLAATTWTPGADGRVTMTAGVGERFPAIVIGCLSSARSFDLHDSREHTF